MIGRFVSQQRKSILRVTALHKLFGKKHAVNNVSFAMKTGEVVGLLGPNGAGKTTLFYMIVGFVHPDGGNIFLDGEIITKTPMFRRAQAGIAYLPQEESVFRKLSVEQNIWAVLEARKDITGEEKIVLLNFLLQELGVTEKRKQKAYTLSGGERRRTEIARALAMNPRFLLLDEPFTGIDPKARFEIKNIISRLGKQGIGVLITDHNERDTMDITHRSNIIYAGEIVVSGSREELMNNELARKIYLGEEYT